MAAVQKRRFSRNPAVLPVVEADRSTKRPSPVSRGRGGRSSNRQCPALTVAAAKLLLSFLALGLFAVYLQRQTLISRPTHFANRSAVFDYFPPDDDDTTRVLPLQDFSSLQYALRNSEIVALYFAASWCPMSTPVTEQIDNLFRDVLLAPPSDDPSIKLPQRHGLSLVHVSSDVTDEALQGYLRPNWMFVPFDSAERNSLKRHFATCAKRELEELQITREHEIPTLVILSGRSHQVLTYHGVKDIQERGVQAVDHWMSLADLTAALEFKYQ